MPSQASSTPRLTIDDCITVDDWKQLAENRISTTECALQRNNQITANYAQAYLKHPHLYKWAAMAAFASHHVRLALKPLALTNGKQPVDERSHRLKNTRIIKNINDSIFNDIYWAHLAYDASSSGLERLIHAVGDDPAYDILVKGFRQLEHARLLLEKDPGSAKAEDLIWEANTELLLHEQTSMVQPRFAKLASGFSRSLSLFATMHYQFGGKCKSTILPGAFFAYMFLKRKNKKKLNTFPNIATLEHRWEWIHDGILPGFRCYENQSSTITRDLKKVIGRTGA